jgi:hypothetical protein
VSSTSNASRAVCSLVSRSSSSSNNHGRSENQ